MSKQEFYILLNKLAIRDTEGIIERGLLIYRETYQTLPFSSNDSHYYDLFKEGLMRGASIKETFNAIYFDLERLATCASYCYGFDVLSRIAETTSIRTMKIGERTPNHSNHGYFTQREFLIRFGVRDIDRFIAMNNFPIAAKMLMQGHNESFIYQYNEKSKQKHN